MVLKGEYTWTEKSDQIKIVIPLKGVSAKSVDIQATKLTLKVNYNPWLLEFVFFKEVNENRNNATVKNKSLQITIFKAVEELWGQLEATGDKEELAAIKHEAQVANEKTQEAHNVLRSDRKHAEEKYSLRKELSLDETERNRVENLKQDEKETAEKEIYKTFQEIQKQEAELKNKKSNTSNTQNTASSTKAVNASSTSVSFNSTLTSSEPLAVTTTNNTTQSTTNHTSKSTQKNSKTALNTANSANDTSKSSLSVDSLLLSDDIEEEAVKVTSEEEDEDYVHVTPRNNDNIQNVASELILAQQQAQAQLKHAQNTAKNNTTNNNTVNKNDIFTSLDLENTQNNNTNTTIEAQVEVDEEEEEVKYIPPPRFSTEVEKGSVAVVGINFTPRVFPTPMRESKASEEEDWVAKNRKHLKKHGVLGKNNQTSGTDVSDSDPVWLKAKGDDFYRYGDFKSAINAYSAALDLDENMTACLSNRSACYLQLNMFHECKEDCLTAIDQLSTFDKRDLFTKDESTTQSTIIKLTMRLGAAYCHLGQFTTSLTTYRNVQNLYFTLKHHLRKVNGDDSELGQLVKGVSEGSISGDIERLELLCTVDSLKHEADLLFSNQQTSDAILKYSEALQLVPFHVSCLSNRSAARMASRDLRGCIEDCTVAIDLLMGDAASGGTADVLGAAASAKSMLSSILPADGTDKRKAWVITTLLRRGMAYAQLAAPGSDLSTSIEEARAVVALLDSAVSDYSQASGLDPQNEALKTDLNKLKTFRESKKVLVQQM